MAVPSIPSGSVKPNTISDLNTIVNNMSSNRFLTNVAKTSVTVPQTGSLIKPDEFSRISTTITNIANTCAHDASNYAFARNGDFTFTNNFSFSRNGDFTFGGNFSFSRNGDFTFSGNFSFSRHGNFTFSGNFSFSRNGNFTFSARNDFDSGCFYK